MLMDTGGAVEPVVDVDVKPGAAKQSYWRIAETSFNVVLLRQRLCGMYPANDVPGVNACRQVNIDERLCRNFREKLFTVVLGFPPVFHQRAEFLKFLHGPSFQF